MATIDNTTVPSVASALSVGDVAAALTLLGLEELKTVYEVFQTGYIAMSNMSSQPRVTSGVLSVIEDVYVVVGKLVDSVVDEASSRTPKSWDDVEDKIEIVVKHEINCGCIREATAAAVNIMSAWKAH
jgi:hypothetical protein